MAITINPYLEDESILVEKETDDLSRVAESVHINI